MTVYGKHCPCPLPCFSVAELSRCFRVESRSKGEAPCNAHCFHKNAALTLDEAFKLCFNSHFSYGLKLQLLLVYLGRFRQNPAQPHGATWKESQEQCTAPISNSLTVEEFCKHIWWRWCLISSNDNFAKYSVFFYKNRKVRKKGGRVFLKNKNDLTNAKSLPSLNI